MGAPSNVRAAAAVLALVLAAPSVAVIQVPDDEQKQAAIDQAQTQTLHRAAHVAREVAADQSAQQQKGGCGEHAAQFQRMGDPRIGHQISGVCKAHGEHGGAAHGIHFHNAPRGGSFARPLTHGIPLPGQNDGYGQQEVSQTRRKESRPAPAAS